MTRSLINKLVPHIVVPLLRQGIILHPLLFDLETHFYGIAGAGCEAGIVLLEEVSLAWLVTFPEAEIGEGMQSTDDVLLLLLPLIKIHNNNNQNIPQKHNSAELSLRS